MPTSWTDEIKARAAARAATPPPATSTDAPSSIGDNLMSGFKNELVSALQMAKNSTSLVDKAVGKLVETGGYDPAQAHSLFRGVIDQIDSAQRDMAPPDTGAPDSVAGRVARGVGAAPVQLAEYGLATLATSLIRRSPTAAFALVDSLKEADKGLVPALIAGAKGAATGAAMTQVAKIQKLAPRLAAGAAVGAAGAKLEGGGPEDIVSGALMGAGFSALPPAAGPDVARDASGKPKAFTVRALKEDLIPGISLLQSPHIKFEHVPGAADVTVDAFNTVARIDSLASDLQTRARQAFRGEGPTGKGKLSTEEQSRLIDYLNDPNYKAGTPQAEAVLPADTPKVQDAFVKLRGVTEQLRDNTLQLKRQQWVAERAGRNPTPERLADLQAAAEEVIPTYGREGYFPHIFEGAWKTVIRKTVPDPKNPGGMKTIERPIETMGYRSETQREAELKAEKYASLHPDIPKEHIVVGPYETSQPGEWASGKGKRFFGSDQPRGAGVVIDDIPPGASAETREQMIRDAQHEGAAGWVKDEEALYKYIDGAVRFVEMSKLRPKLEGVRGWIEENLPGSETAKQWKQYEDQVEGRPDRFTRGFNEEWVAMGGSPDVVQRATGFTRGVEGLLKLGFSPASAISNLSQFGTNAVPVLGVKYAFKGFKGAVETFTRAALEKVGASSDIPKGAADYRWLLKELDLAFDGGKADTMGTAEQLRLFLPTDSKARPEYWLRKTSGLGLWMFSKAEQANRAATVIGAYERGIDSGLSKQAAIRKAREVELRTQFAYNAADAPVLLSSPWAKTAFQFQNFFLKQMEFMMGMASGKSDFGRFDSRNREVGRFLTSILLTTGAVGMPGIESADALIESATGESLLKHLRGSDSKVLQVASRGLPGLVGLDLSRNVGFGDYLSPSKLPSFGPAVTEAKLVIQAILANNGQDQQQYIDQLTRRISPQGRRIVEAWNNQFRDSKGRLIEGNLPTTERWLAAGGFLTTESADKRAKYIRLNEIVREHKSERYGYIDVIAKAIADGDDDLAERLAEEAQRSGHANVWSAANKKARENNTERLESFENRYRQLVPVTDEPPPLTPIPGVAPNSSWADEIRALKSRGQ